MKNAEKVFTLAGGATHTNKLQIVSNGFTLAEVLITLTIIGVVAAMTIPTVVAKINKKITDYQEVVFRAKMIKGFNLAKTAGDLNNTYNSTYEFLTNGLSNHLKLVKICDKDHIRECVPYDKITYVKDDKDETFALNKMNTAHSLNLNEENGFKDSAAFVLGDGTIVIGSYKQDCIVDTEELDKEISSCFDGLYDLNGTRKPNKLGKDIFPIRSAGIDASPAVLATINGVKIITNVAAPSPMTKAECEANKTKYGINECGVSTDYWAGAVKTCKDAGGRLPTVEELTKIAQEVYNDTSLTTDYRALLTLDTSKVPIPLSGLAYDWRRLWSGQENSYYYASRRIFYAGSTAGSDSDSYDNYGRGSSYPLAVCVTD